MLCWLELAVLRFQVKECILFYSLFPSEFANSAITANKHNKDAHIIK